MLTVGEAIGRYTIEEELGRGGMAVVFKVRHNQLGATYALKLVRLMDDSARRRFAAEGRAQAALRHPNIAMVVDVVEVGGMPGLVMEYVDGPPLNRWLARHKPDLRDALAIFDGIIQGVAHAHAHGLIHRDLKPGNVLLAMGRDLPFPKITDFGLARHTQRSLVEEETASGLLLGTPGFMAPEQIHDPKSVDARADVFSLGCILYQMVCGRKPFDSDSVVQLLNDVVAGRYIPPEELAPDLPQRVREAIAGCLEPDRARRIPDCDALREVLSGERRHAIPERLFSAPGYSEDTWGGSVSIPTPGSDQTLERVRERVREQKVEALRRAATPNTPHRPEPAELDTQAREARLAAMTPTVWRKKDDDTAPGPARDPLETTARVVAGVAVVLGTLAVAIWLFASGPPAEETPPPLDVGGVAEQPLPVEEPAAPAPRPHAPARVTVFVTGGKARVCLQADARCYDEGPLPAGTYPVWVMAKSGGFQAGEVTLAPGERATVRCDLSEGICAKD
ncbi:MAG: serine/threonine protein kinase [Alphaproteobacteria bacterium]|nr:serine/threonine protein kinase [Alphaproteobacteria bacterium]